MGMLVIMQGLPGSGKDFIVRRDYPSAVVASADNYFRKLNSNYDNGGNGFDPTKLGKAHAECYADVVSFLNTDCPLIVVNNTNLDNESIAAYVAIAQYYGYEVEICRIKCDARTAAARNTHGVPLGAYGRMQSAFDRWIFL